MKPGSSPRLFACLLTAAALIACNDTVAGLGPPSDPATETFAASLNVNIASMTRLPSGVYIRDDTVGTGVDVTDQADTIVVNYAGYLKDGTLFDSGNNITMVRGQLVAGFRNGVVGMKVGGTRKIVIPSEQGYGGASQKDASTGEITIPRQSTLIFDVKMIRVHIPAATPPVALRAD
jgi:peptidylprolyl isomerase